MTPPLATPRLSAKAPAELEFRRHALDALGRERESEISSAAENRNGQQKRLVFLAEVKLEGDGSPVK